MESINKSTGEITQGELNKVELVKIIRPNGTIRLQQDFSFCPTMAEQHTAHLSNLNYLMDKYQPDELDAYLAARAQYRREIIGHDFSNEPSLQDAKNVVYQSRKAFEELPEDIKRNFKNHVEFLKFIDNPGNQDKMIKMGLLKPKQIEDLVIKDGTVTQPSSNADDVGGEGPAKAKQPSSKSSRSSVAE